MQSTHEHCTVASLRSQTTYLVQLPYLARCEPCCVQLTCLSSQTENRSALRSLASPRHTQRGPLEHTPNQPTGPTGTNSPPRFLERVIPVGNPTVSQTEISRVSTGYQPLTSTGYQPLLSRHQASTGYQPRRRSRPALAPTENDDGDPFGAKVDN